MAHFEESGKIGRRQHSIILRLPVLLPLLANRLHQQFLQLTVAAECLLYIKCRKARNHCQDGRSLFPLGERPDVKQPLAGGRT